MADQKDDLQQIIAGEIQAGGPVPFARFMELCLYHPQWGYYQRQEPVTGPSGDFYTAPHVHALFGRTVANWIQRSSAEMGLEETTVIELGPGNGQLARDILDQWADKRISLSMILVEKAGPRRCDLEARFADDPVRIVDPGDLDELEPVKGVVLANEFFDALPLRVLVRAGGSIQEVYVDYDGKGFGEVLFPARIDGAAAEVMEYLPEGFRTEVSDLWPQWMRRIARVLQHGRLLVLDYGELTEALIVPWRETGSLRCYHRHQVDSNPLDMPGEKDITAHVNFSLLEHWGEDAGLCLRSLVSQSSFLIKGGILEMLAKNMEQLSEREATGLWLTVKNLIHEDGMGEVFKAMVMEKKRPES